MSRVRKPKYDVFISHATEDKAALARPLAEALANFGLSVWYDEFTLIVGDSLSQLIDKGLRDSAFGLVILSPAFFNKKWTRRELAGLVAREIDEDSVIIPVWHSVTRSRVVKFSPTLADKLAILTDDQSVTDIAIQVLRRVSPETYRRQPRHELEAIANGTALRELREKHDQTADHVEDLENQVAEYSCPFCGAGLVTRSEAPVGDRGDTDWYDVFKCGHCRLGYSSETLCPLDPSFPAFEDLEFECARLDQDDPEAWIRKLTATSRMSNRVWVSPGAGTTEEDAVANFYKHYCSLTKKP